MKNNNLNLKVNIINGGFVGKISTMQSAKKQPKINIFWLIVAGLIIGFINGFWGGGGGMVCVPVLTSLLKLPEKKGHATTLLIMLPLSIASFVIYCIKGSVDIPTAVNVGVGFVLGGVIGALLLKNINNLILKIVFSVVIIAGGIKLIIWWLYGLVWLE